MVPSKVEYCIHCCNLNASTIRIIKQGSKYGDSAGIALEKLDTLKPTYLIVGDAQYDIFFKAEVKREILKHYDIVFHSETFYLYNGLVLKRIEAKEEVISQMGEGGTISGEIFKRTVPSVMEVGESYTALVKIENTGKSSRDFFVHIYSEGYELFIEYPSRDISLDESSTSTAQFTISPVTAYVGELPITVDLYATAESGAMKKVDSVTDYVYFIER